MKLFFKWINDNRFCFAYLVLVLFVISWGLVNARSLAGFSWFVVPALVLGLLYAKRVNTVFVRAFLQHAITVFLCLAMAGAAWRTGMMNSFAVSAVILMGFKWILYGEKPVFPPWFAAPVLFVFAVLVFSGLAHPLSGGWLKMVLRFGRYILFFWAVAIHFKTADLRHAVYVLSAVALVTGLWALMQKATGIGLFDYRAGAQFYFSNMLGTYAALVIPFLAAWVLYSRDNRISQVLVGISAAILGAGLIFSLSRAGWLACAAGLGFIAARRYGMKTAAAGLAIIFLVLFTVPATQNRLVTLVDAKYRTNATRVDFWARALKLAASRPATGQGIVNKHDFPALLSSAWAKPLAESVPHTHQQFLNWSLLSGIGALAALGWLISSLAMRIAPAGPAIRANMRAVRMGVVASLVSFSILCLADTPFYIISMASFFWLLMGLGAAAADLEEQAD